MLLFVAIVVQGMLVVKRTVSLRQGLCMLFLLLTSVRKRTSLVKIVVFFRRLSACEKTQQFSPTSTEGARKKEHA